MTYDPEELRRPVLQETQFVNQGCRIVTSVANGDAARERIRSWRVQVAECFWVYLYNRVFANEFV
jgi:hypothetical protein